MADLKVIKKKKGQPPLKGGLAQKICGFKPHILVL